MAMMTMFRTTDNDDADADEDDADDGLMMTLMMTMMMRMLMLPLLNMHHGPLLRARHTPTTGTRARISVPPVVVDHRHNHPFYARHYPPDSEHQ